MPPHAKLFSLCLLTGAILGITAPAPSQIGGQTAADGDFVIDDFEDLDLVADSLGRNWVITVIVNAPGDLELSGKGLTLAADQSPVGAMNTGFRDDGAIIVGSANSAFGSFGVPMPGTVGVSTDPNAGGDPGDITSFEWLRFTHCYQLSGGQPQTEVTFNVLLECYPGNPDSTFPTLVWNVPAVQGTAFQKQAVDLRSPDLILNNPDSHTVEALLSQTRFLNFYFIATPVNVPATLRVFMDDVLLTANEPTSTPTWHLYN